MAVNDVYRPNVDYTLASQVTSPVSAKTAFVPAVQVTNASGGVGSTTGTKTSVNSAAVSTTILAANTARLGATITNTDGNALDLDLSGGTASTTSYSVQIAPGGYFELPSPVYTGKITGIWTADGSGAALVTEFT